MRNGRHRTGEQCHQRPSVAKARSFFKTHEDSEQMHGAIEVGGAFAPLAHWTSKASWFFFQDTGRKRAKAKLNSRLWTSKHGHEVFFATISVVVSDKYEPCK